MIYGINDICEVCITYVNDALMLEKVDMWDGVYGLRQVTKPIDNCPHDMYHIDLSRYDEYSQPMRDAIDTQ